MSNVLSSLVASTGALRAYSRMLDVVQNNVSNATTPGYVKQELQLVALPFSPETGTSGGVRTSELESARNEYAEQAVRRQTIAAGEFQQKAASLTAVQGGFDIASDQGIPGAMNRLFQQFSAWSVDPNSSVARQSVLDEAGRLATAFRSAAQQFQATRTVTERQVQDTVSSVNDLTARLRDLNVECRRGDRTDAGLDARMHSTLEELSQLVDFNAVRQEDGTFTVLLDGQTPLVAGEQNYPLSFSFAQTAGALYPNAPPDARILDPVGRDITSQITTGKLGALLDVRNRVLPQILGNGSQAGDLNVLAKAMADRINAILTSGNVTDGPPAQAGAALFSYDVTNDAAVAQSLSLDPAVTPESLAAIDPGPPEISNGIPLRLAALSNPQEAESRVDGCTYTEFYGSMASRVGGELSTASDNADMQKQLVSQASEIREQISGISLDEEAALLIEFQRAYQANSRVITVLDQLAQDTVDLIK